MTRIFNSKILHALAAGLIVIVCSLYSLDGQANESAGSSIFSDAATDQQIRGIVQRPINIDGENLDYAHLWYKQILGGFIFYPWKQMDGLDNGAYDANDVTLLGKAVGFSNILAMILCLVAVYYLIVGGALNTAADGEVLGKAWNTPWLMIRTSIGFALITPLKAVGGVTLSFSQILVIWLLMIGSNAGSVLWEYVIKELAQGTPVVSPQIDLGVAKTADLMKMLICSDGYVRANTDDDATGNEEDVPDYEDRALYSVYYQGEEEPYIAQSQTASGGQDYMWGDEKFILDSEKNIEKIEFGPGGNCGEISFPIVNGDHSDNDEAEDVGDGVDALSYKQFAIQGGGQAFAEKLGEVINILLKSVRVLSSNSEDLKYLDIYEHISSEDFDENHDLYQLYLTGYESFKEAAEKYATEIPDAVHKGASGNKKVVKKMYEEMEYGGWTVAGLWFYDISALPGLTHTAINSIHSSIEPEAIDFCFPLEFWGNCDDMEEGSTAGYEISGFYLQRLVGESPSYISGADEALTGCNEKGNCSGGANSASDRYSMSIAKAILGHLGNSGENINPIDNPGQLSSPFLFAAEIGHTLNTYAQYGILAGVGIYAAIQASNDIAEVKKKSILGKAKDLFTVLPGADKIRWIAQFFKHLLTGLMIITVMSLAAIVLTCMSSGFLLAYVVPFMPVMTWIMMMAGYMLTVVEAIVAAPLAVILLFTPEGQGISGSRFERALQLVAMAILRPSFMVLGMLAGLTVSFVSFGMMNTFFFRAAEHVLSGTVFDVIAIIVLYVSATYQLCKLMVEAMHSLPDRIAEWFAGGISRPFGESRISDNAEGTLGGISSQIQNLPGKILAAQTSMLSKNENDADPSNAGKS